MNFFSAERIGLETRTVFETLRTPRGEATCDRLLAMIGIDTDELEMAEMHAERARRVFAELGDPWGVLETNLLLCQVHLARGTLPQAERLFDECQRVSTEEAEPRQHLLLTRAWLECEKGTPEVAFTSVEAAAAVFGPKTRAGDHTPHLLSRLSRFSWSPPARERIETWRRALNDRGRRQA
jgi:hypothetical protein